MCESCSSPVLDRREFLAAAGALGATAFVSRAVTAQTGTRPAMPPTIARPVDRPRPAVTRPASRPS